MTDAAKEARRAYTREWQRANKEKVRDYQKRYWERKARGETPEKPQGDSRRQEYQAQYWEHRAQEGEEEHDS